ncbi:MAG: hypothetical protein EPO02_05540 [Nitrospirae bacterium]|nr:MAG: hypothetical protein EPO02_05540 [Nitrospirota bacterium]
MPRVLPILFLIAVFLGGCVPLSMHGALREAFDKAEAENKTVKKELAQALAESKRLQQEAASLKAANEALTRQARELSANLQQLNREKIGLAEQVASAQAALAAREAEKTALAVRAEEQALALRRMEAVKAPRPAAEPEREKPPRTLEAALKDEIANGSGSIRRGDGVVTIELMELLLYYNSAAATIRPEGLKVLKRIADVLKDGAEKEIRIEAHTDVVIRTTRFPSNMDLAVARANGVLRFLKTQHTADPVRMSAVGYAEPQVVTAGAGAQSRNRRVEIIVRSR